MSALAFFPARRRRLSVEDFYRMAEAGIFGAGERVELIEGEVVELGPIGALHASAVRRLNAVFAKGAAGQAIVSVQNPVRLGPRSEPQPDLALLRPRGDYYRDAHPGPADVLLLVEVADASLRYDVEVKLPLYAQSGVAEVWIVDLAHRRLEIHRRPEGDAYLEKHCPLPGEAAAPAALPDCRVEPGLLF